MTQIPPTPGRDRPGVLPSPDDKRGNRRSRTPPDSIHHRRFVRRRALPAFI
jgi:hypothetical protein